MAVTLTKNNQDLAFAINSGDRSLYYHLLVRYADTNNPLQKTVIVTAVGWATGEMSANVSGVTFTAWVNGASQVAYNTSISFPKGGLGSGPSLSFTVTYDSASGRWDNKNVSMTLSGGSGRYSNGEYLDTGSMEGTLSVSVSLPAIDPAPTVAINGVSILSGDLSGNAVASVSKLRVNITYKNTRSMSIKWVGAGIDSGNKSISVSYSTSDQTKNYDMDVNVPPSSSDYTLKFTVTYGNNTLSNQTKTYNYAINGYWLPTYDNGTYTQRCDVNGNADAQGEYGRLYLKWKFASINGANAMSSISVKLNGTTLVNGQNCVITGSISAGYLNYIFPLTLSTQGDLSIIMTDLITTVTIDNLAVPKSIMALSLYQNNTDVGVTIGRMATQAGFYEALDFYLKGKDHGTFYELSIDTNGVLYVNGNPVAYTSGGSV